jgi:hypothetical protein
MEIVQVVATENDIFIDNCLTTLVISRITKGHETEYNGRFSWAIEYTDPDQIVFSGSIKVSESMHKELCITEDPGILTICLLDQLIKDEINKE